MNTLKMEFYKLKHKKMGMMVILIGLFQYIYLAWAITKMHSDKIGQEWMTCLYVVFQINIILMPLFIAMMASRLSDIEHKGNTFKCLKVLVRHVLFPVPHIEPRWPCCHIFRQGSTY